MSKNSYDIKHLIEFYEKYKYFENDPFSPPTVCVCGQRVVYPFHVCGNINCSLDTVKVINEMQEDLELK